MIVTPKRVDDLQNALTILKKLNANARNLFIDQMKNETINLLIKCIELIIKDQSRLSNTQLRQIHAQAKNIRELAAAKTLQRKKRILQKGGFLGAILGPLLGSVVPSLLGAIIPQRR
jgi:hypothetical protein